MPRSLGIAAPSNIFNATYLDNLVSQARSEIGDFAKNFSNGNPTLENGIAMQLSLALDLYQQDKELPLELNLGM